MSSSVNWIADVMLGPLATAIMVLAVAMVGLMLLRGRTSWQIFTRVVAGCVLLSGARSMAEVLISARGSEQTSPVAWRAESPPLVQPLPAAAVQPFDPYAGASLMTAPMTKDAARSAIDPITRSHGK